MSTVKNNYVFAELTVKSLPFYLFFPNSKTERFISHQINSSNSYKTIHYSAFRKNKFPPNLTFILIRQTTLNLVDQLIRQNFFSKGIF